MRHYFLLKTEADEYGWEHLLAEGTGRWDGVRNYAARNQLRAMKQGDWAFFYHTGKERRVVGVVEVAQEHYPDPTATEGDWSVVEVRPVALLPRAVSLAEIKADERLADMVLVQSSRLSVQPVTREQFSRVLLLGESSLKKMENRK